MNGNSDDILDQWLNFSDEEKEAESTFGEPIPKASFSITYPLSVAQQRLWFVYQKNPESAVYNYSEIWDFQNQSFDQESFSLALDYLVEKHRILASNYIIFQEEPVMVFRRDEKYSLHASTEVLSKGNARIWLKQLASKSFRLETDPLIRVGICQLENGGYHVGITFHHINIDAWSMGILRQDFANFYKSISPDDKKAEYDLGQSDLQYVDYTSWQKNLPLKPSKDALNSSFSHIFLELPLDYPRPATPSYKGKLIRFSLPKELSPKVSEILKSHHTTDFNLFLACFQLLLGRYAKSNHVNVGIPVLNRDKDEFKSMVGYFVDTQVIVGELFRQKPFSEFLQEVKNEVLSAISSQKESYEELVNASSELKDESYNPLFQAMFVGHSAGENPFHSLNLPVDFEVLDLDVAKFDLTLHHFGLKNGIYHIGIEISDDLFSPVFAERLVQHFSTLLSEICDNPALPLESYSLISVEEKQYLTSGLSHGFHPEKKGSVLKQILENLSKNKNKTAVVCGSERLNYSELNQRSQLIAQELRKKNADPNQPLGIYLERSVDFLVSILAILRFGGAYLPLDPEYPDQRILQYLKESGAKYVLTHGRLIQSKDPIREVVDLIEIDSLDYNQEIDFKIGESKNKGDNAYLIFTSGSTNKPKGVLVSHENLYSSIAARKSYYQDEPSAFLLLSSFSFDSSVAGIFWTLCTGGKLVITQKEETLDTNALSTLLDREEISHALMLPSLYQALLQGKDKSWNGLKGVILAGEEFPNDIIAAHFEKVPDARLFNEYGPTEGTVWCTVQELRVSDSFHRVPIGLSTSNTLAYVLDENQDLSPTGISGELCIAGSGVVNGYLSRSENESKFLKNPFHKERGKIYLTGDLVRIQENGLMEFLGRIDNQVKVRGHRVELNEIQELAQRFSLNVTAVALATEVPDQKIILAYKTRKPLVEEELMGYLQQNLPKYMVPDQLVGLADFPLLPNGKVDLKALEKIAKSKPIAASEKFKVPSTYLERQVAGIWADVMGVDEVPVNRDFNELGGNSLQSIQIIARCRDIGIKVTPAQFLRYSTVESLVKSLNHETYTRPENTLELAILKVWEKNLEQKLIGVKDSFQKNGGSDFEWKSVKVELNSTYDFSKEIQISDTIKDIAEKVNTFKNGIKVKVGSIKRVIPIQTIGSKSPVFCIHSEFYYETVYSQLTRHLPSEYPVYGILSVSPELVKESVPKNMAEIASLCLAEIKIIQPSGPYRILSYSIGNVVLFELAKQLREEGSEVKLIMIDPPLFFDKSRTFGKGGYKKFFTYVDYLKNPIELVNKLKKRVNKAKNQPVLIKDTGLLKKYILAYQPKKIDCDTLLITTPREFKHTYGWEPLLNIVDREEIMGPHLKLMREPYTGQMNEAIARNLKRWENE
ncbi:non-ribosomal peptide synthetase [Cyclobacterium salsum]|uniref:non-ribosomal peptide synthetase n=1 Tax=Cyclobacterium salsum TaxID=2666329 RepID=UPI001391AF06|nr:non-ribosomal peptide synthetase [Cyclobacterium salsum]